MYCIIMYSHSRTGMMQLWISVFQFCRGFAVTHVVYMNTQANIATNDHPFQQFCVMSF